MKREGLTGNQYRRSAPALATRVIVDHTQEYTFNPAVEQCLADDISLRNQIIDAIRPTLYTRERAIAFLEDLEERGFRIVPK